VLEKEERLPDAVIACVGGGSNAIGMFADFIDELPCALSGSNPVVTASRAASTARRWSRQQGGLLGMHSFLMQDNQGQIQESYSVSAGLDFLRRPPARPPGRHRPRRVPLGDRQGGAGRFPELAKSEGIIPALESSHALAHALKMARSEPEKEQVLIVNLSGRGDKDIFTVADIFEKEGTLS
jgi:tryptophan synthase beta chain